MRVGSYKKVVGSNTLRLALFTDDDRVLDVQAATSSPSLQACFARSDLDLFEGAPFSHGWLTRRGLAFLRQLLDRCTADPAFASLFYPCAAVWLGPPVPRPGKFIAAGRNYADHLREGQRIWKERGKEVRKAAFPTAFAKFSSAIIGDDEHIVLPPGVGNVDYEIELVVVIGEPALCIAPEQALQHAAGYTICNDVASRTIQLAEMEHQIGIVLAKNFPTFAPLGPWLVTADEIPDPQRLDIEMFVNGEVRQRANTAEMIFPVAELISYWSQLGLQTGDMITTGTPAGVALARPDPAAFYLKDGDRVEARIERVGTLRNSVKAAR